MRRAVIERAVPHLAARSRLRRSGSCAGVSPAACHGDAYKAVIESGLVEVCSQQALTCADAVVVYAPRARAASAVEGRDLFREARKMAFGINNSIKQIAVLEGEVLDSLMAIVQAFIQQAGRPDVSSYAPGRINAWNGPKADLRYKGNFFTAADYWCPELHQFCERLMSGYHACLITYSGDGETGKGIGLHGDQSYAAFTARSVNLQVDLEATTPWLMGQQYPGMAYSRDQQVIAHSPAQAEAGEGEDLYQFELRHGSVIEFNCKNPHAAHPAPGRYSINLWAAASTKNAPAKAAWDELITQHGRSGGGKLIETGIQSVLPKPLNFSQSELAQMQAPPIVRKVTAKQYYAATAEPAVALPRPAAPSASAPKLSDFLSESYQRSDVLRVPKLIQQGYRIAIRAVASHDIARSDLMIISGGQDGADQGGLIAAARLGLPTGGIAPHGWLVSTGTAQDLLQSYGLIEGPAAESDAGAYRIRTVLNAAQADATIVFGSVDLATDKGSYLTLQLARWYAESEGKAYCHIEVADLMPQNMQATIMAIREWLEDGDIRILNVAGNRQRNVRPLDLAGAVAECLQAVLAEPLQ